MDLILLLFAVSVLICVRRNHDGEDALSINNMRSLRGVLAIAIILHHMSERTSGGVAFPFMRHMGYLIVAYFFFLSGYGLLFSYINYAEKYLDKLRKKRIPYLLIIYLLTSFIYACYHVLCGSFKFSLTIAANSWYLVIQLLLYMIFWISYSLLGSKSIPKAICFSAFLETFLLGILVSQRKSGIWYISNYAFVLGMVWRYYKTRINKILDESYWRVVIVVLLLFVVFSGLPAYINCYAFCRIVSTLLFCILVVLFFQMFKFTGVFWGVIGGISLEIYLIHGLVYSSLRSKIYVIENEALWTCLTVVISVALAFPFRQLNKRIASLLGS